MTTLNTTIGEEKVIEKIGLASFGGVAFEPSSEYREKILKILTIAMQRAYEAGRADWNGTYTL